MPQIGYGGYTGYGSENPNNPNALQKVLDIIGSKGGQTITSAVGAGMAAYGQSKQAEAERAQSAQQFAASMAQRQLEADQANQMSRATSAASADPLGASQQYAQRNALLAAILPGLRNYSVTPGDPAVASAMGKPSGGFRLPEGGFDPAMIDRLFGDKATQSSLMNRAQQVAAINPRGTSVNLEDLYGPSSPTERNPFQTGVESYRQGELDRQLEESRNQRAIIQRAIDEDIAGEKQKKEKKGSGFWSKLAKIGLMAAPFVAAPFTGGASLALIGAGAGAASGAMNGGGIKGALLGGATGALSTGLPIKGGK